MATLLRPRRARSAGELAAATPDSRERPVDLLRAVAIVTVVVGHWLAVTVVVLDGTVTGESVLRVLPWTHPLTWIFQVMPVFFLVGGYANAASWTTAQDRGVGWVGWLTARGDRLLRPTTLFVAVGAGGCALARLGGLDPRLAQRAGWLVAISLWFLAVYLAVVALTPAMLALHRRCGLGVPFALGVAVAVVDVLRLGFDVPAVGGLNFGLVWLAVHQLGFAWRDGRLLVNRARPKLLAAAGAATLVALVSAGPYPVSMINVPGARLHNTSPPSLALLALAVTQTGLILLARPRLARWCRRPRVWLATVATNGVVMSLYLWHMVPVVLVAPALYLSDWWQSGWSGPAIGTPTWYLLRLPWVIILAVALVGILIVVAPVERGRTPARAPAGPERRVGRLVAVAGIPVTCTGLIALTVGGLSAPSGLLGIPTTALGTYAVGVVLLRLAAAIAVPAMPAAR